MKHRIRNTLLFSLFFVFITSVVSAQEARLQAIHNAPDPVAETVDIYFGDSLVVDNFSFRSATPFVTVPAGVEISIGIAPAESDSSDDAIATFPVTLADGETYVAVASGVLDPNFFDENPDGRDIAFTLLLTDGARETADDTSKIEVLAVHGITDAPSLDVLDASDSLLVDNLGYGDITGYLAFEEGIVSLEVTPAEDNDSPLITSEVDLTGLAGTAAVVLASGFLEPDDNQEGPAAAALAVFPDGTVDLRPLIGDDDGDDEDRGCTYSQGFWKNHPGAWPEDISPHDRFLSSEFTWMEVLQTPPVGGNAYFILGHQFVAAYLNVLNGADASDIADALDRAEELLAESSPYNPPNGELRTEAIGLSEFLDDYNNGRIGPGSCDDDDKDDDDGDDKDEFAYLQVIHNAADPLLDTVDVYLGQDRILDDFAFRTATPFVPVPAETVLTVGLAPGTSESSGDVVRSFPVEFDDDESYVAIASGVLDTTAFVPNSDGRNIGLTVFLRDNVRKSSRRKVHVPRGHYPPPGLCRLWYYGIPPGHQPPPVNCEDIGRPGSRGRLVRHSGPVHHGSDDVSFFLGHMATDAPTVDVLARDVALLVDDASYGDITDYITVPADTYVLDVTPGDDNETIVASFEADLSGLGGQAAAVLASGFLDPSGNQDGPAFTLIAVLTDGTVIELGAAEGAAESIFGTTALEATGEVPGDFVLEAAYPNPFNPTTRIEFGLPEAGDVRLSVYNALGQRVRVLVDDQVPAGTYTVTFDAGNLPSGTYFYHLETGSGSETRSIVLLK